MLHWNKCLFFFSLCIKSRFKVAISIYTTQTKMRAKNLSRSMFGVHKIFVWLFSCGFSFFKLISFLFDCWVRDYRRSIFSFTLSHSFLLTLRLLLIFVIEICVHFKWTRAELKFFWDFLVPFVLLSARPWPVPFAVLSYAVWLLLLLPSASMSAVRENFFHCENRDNAGDSANNETRRKKENVLIFFRTHIASNRQRHRITMRILYIFRLFFAKAQTFSLAHSLISIWMFSFSSFFITLFLLFLSATQFSLSFIPIQCLKERAREKSISSTHTYVWDIAFG